VGLALAARERLASEGIAARVVSIPCREWFDEQGQAYKDSVIPPEIKARVSVEAGVSMGWRELVGDAGRIISIEHYGASAAGSKLFEEFGFSADTVLAAAKESLAAAGQTTAATHAAAAGPKGPADTVEDPGVTIS
jgi:transketolase